MKLSKIRFSLFVAVVISLFGTILSAQEVMRDVSGKTILQKNVLNMSGSTFLSEEWSKGIIKFTDSFSSKPIEIKYNQLEDIVLFKNDKQEVMIVDEPVKEFKIFLIKDGSSQEKVFRAGFNPINNNSDKAFYEIIADGKVNLLNEP